MVQQGWGYGTAGNENPTAGGQGNGVAGLAMFQKRLKQ